MMKQYEVANEMNNISDDEEIIKGVDFMSEGDEMYEGIKSTIEDLIDEYRRIVNGCNENTNLGITITNKVKAEGAIEALEALIDLLEN